MFCIRRQQVPIYPTTQLHTIMEHTVTTLTVTTTGNSQFSGLKYEKLQAHKMEVLYKFITLQSSHHLNYIMSNIGTITEKLK